MRLTVSSYSFEAIPLDGALAVAKSMGFKGVDIGGFHNRGRASYEPDEVAAKPQKFADALRKLLERYELDAVDFFPQFGSSPNERSLNDPDAAVRKQNVKSFKGIVKFCQLANIPGITILPGVDHLGRTKAQDMALSAKMLKQFAEIAGESGVGVQFEPHMGSVCGTPEWALELVEQAPGMKITLDYSHFLLQYIPLERAHMLIPHTGHFHVRQSRPGRLQTRFAEGTLDFVDIAKRLKAAGYKGCMSVEYVCADWYDINNVDTLFETMATKAALEKHIKV
jgi:sugar phosphate isomerase/epimerase